MTTVNSFFPTMQLTSSGRPILFPGEIECCLLSSVDLFSEENPSFPHLKSGILTLTTHRLIWIPESSGTSFNPIYIPLSAVTNVFSRKKSIKSLFSSRKIRFQAFAAPVGKVDERGSRTIVITLTLGGKSEPEAFLAKFWEALKGRAWEDNQVGTSEAQSAGSVTGESSLALRMPVVGVAGILRKEQEMWESTDKSLQDAFQDLNALMSKAKEMVTLAEKMRLKLLSGPSSGGSNEDEMGTKEEMQDWLLSIGIASPVTKESAGALYHQQLSRQLADFVRIPLDRAGGMINLIDIYCLFNRARGTELISPDDLNQACRLWEKFDVPVMLRKFDSGVMIIQNKTHSDEEVFRRIKSLVMLPDALRHGVSASDAAITLGVAPGMAKEYLLTAELKGLLCRDVSSDGFRFYINLFQEINSDDVYFVKDHGIYAGWISAQ